MSTSWRRVLDAQMGQWRWIRSPYGQAILRAKFADETAPLRDSTRELLGSMYGAEENKLLSADPIFVSSEMCDVVKAAADVNQQHPFQPEPLYVTDLVTPCGFMLYERPFDVIDRFDDPVQISGASWSPMFSLAENEEPGSIDQETLWRAWNDADHKPDWDDKSARASGVALTLYTPLSDASIQAVRARGLTPPPLDLLHLTPWFFGMSFDGNEIDENGVQTGAEWWWRIIQTTFRLMQQRIAHQHHWRPERHVRREAKRLQFPQREVLVIRLRRSKSDNEPGEGGAVNWTHRWLVGGHWRQQWYPKAGEHRQIWISPYQKGPEDLPLLIKPRRAMAWTR